MYSLTVFKSPRWWEAQQRFVYDNKTHRRIDISSWDNLVTFFRKLSERPLNGKQDAELISPAIFKPDSTRKNDNVLAWAGWAAVDVDDHEFEGDLEDALRSSFGAYRYVVYSTASSTDTLPKFRIVFQIGTEVEQSRIRHFWFALNSELGSIGDKQTKDFCRMYYVPATYAGANNFFFVNDGEPLDVDYLCARWPFEERTHSNSFIDRLPDAWRDQVIEHRKSSLDNTDVHWSGYSDCPFWPKKLANDYLVISKEGWYRKMYQIMIGLAGNAIKNEYPMTSNQIADMCKQFDAEHGNWYESRPLETEANNALEYVYKNGGLR